MQGQKATQTDRLENLRLKGDGERGDRVITEREQGSEKNYSKKKD